MDPLRNSETELKVYSTSFCSIYPIILVNYSLALEDGSVVAKNEDKQRPFKFRLGSAEVIRGFETAVLSMQVGETASYVIQPEYAYGAAGLDDLIKPNAVIHLIVTLLEVEPVAKSRWELDEDERLSLSVSLKNDGNEQFKNKQIESARDTYREAFKYIEFDTGDKFHELKISLLLNIALMCNKLKEYTESVSAADQALDVNELSAKALYRRASAKQGLMQLDEAAADLHAALAIEPDNQDVKNEIAKIKDALTKQKAREKQLYEQMFK